MPQSQKLKMYKELLALADILAKGAVIEAADEQITALSSPLPLSLSSPVMKNCWIHYPNRPGIVGRSSLSEMNWPLFTMDATMRTPCMKELAVFQEYPQSAVAFLTEPLT